MRRAAPSRLTPALVLALLAVSPVAALPSRAAPPGAWPTFHGDFSLAGASDAPLPDTLVRRWRYDAGAPVASPPVSDGSRIFVVTERGEAVALDPGGRKVWSRVLAARPKRGTPAARETVDAPPLSAFGLLVLGSRSGNLHALDAATGAVRWTTALGAEIRGSPNAVPAGDGRRGAIVAVTRPDGVVHLVDPATGRRLSRSAPTNRTDGPPSVHAGRIVYGNCDAALHAFTPSGATAFKVPLEAAGEVFAGVALSGDRAYVGDRSGRFAAVDLKARKVLWADREKRGEASATPAVPGGTAVFASGDGTVLAFDAKSGRRLWRFDAPGAPGSPVAAGDKVVVAADGSLFLLSLSDGRLLWSARVSDAVTSPALAVGLVVAGGDDGSVVAFGAPPPTDR